MDQKDLLIIHSVLIFQKKSQYSQLCHDSKQVYVTIADKQISPPIFQLYKFKMSMFLQNHSNAIKLK